MAFLDNNKADELVEALRCSATPDHKDCEGCKYRCLEPVDMNIPVRTDIVIDGVEYWESCDCDQIVLDAADMIEAMNKAIRGEV